MHLGEEPIEVTCAESMLKASHLILPGVGSFPAAMEKLTALGLVEPLRECVVAQGKPFLGICVGMQLLADTGFEFGETSGLGLIEGEVKEIEAAAHDLSVPHIGWNDLEVETDHFLLRNCPPRPSFYFVHSFSFRCKDSENEVASCEYGTSITSIIEKENIFGVQFHPEKSQRDGLQLLKNFTEL